VVLRHSAGWPSVLRQQTPSGRPPSFLVSQRRAFDPIASSLAPVLGHVPLGALTAVLAGAPGLQATRTPLSAVPGAAGSRRRGTVLRLTLFKRHDPDMRSTPRGVGLWLRPPPVPSTRRRFEGRKRSGHPLGAGRVRRAAGSRRVGPDGSADAGSWGAARSPNGGRRARAVRTRSFFRSQPLQPGICGADGRHGHRTSGRVDDAARARRRAGPPLAS
jgi:hypothetical protein